MRLTTVDMFGLISTGIHLQHSVYINWEDNMKSGKPAFFIAFFVAITLFSPSPVFAEEDAESMATHAVTDIIFDNVAEGYISYRISSKGEVDLIFARDTPDAVYSDILNKMKKHPDIKSVLAGRGGPSCGLFR